MASTCGKELEVGWAAAKEATVQLIYSFNNQVSWKDLMACKPDSIDQASHESFLKEALLGIKACGIETEESALSLHLELTASGNLSFSWKLKQCNFTVHAGFVHRFAHIL